MLQLSGEPATVAEQVSFIGATPQIAASADMNGTLMYLVNSRPDRQLVWYDRSGTELSRAAPTGSGVATGVSLAPDGKRVAFRALSVGVPATYINVYATDAQPSLEVILDWGRDR